MLDVLDQSPKYGVELCFVLIAHNLNDVQVFLRAIWILFCIDEFLQLVNFISTI